MSDFTKVLGRSTNDELLENIVKFLRKKLQGFTYEVTSNFSLVNGIFGGTFPWMMLWIRHWT